MAIRIKKQLQIFLVLLLPSFVGMINLNARELKSFASIKGLQDLTLAFFSQPEFKGDFNSRYGNNKPSSKQRGLNAATLKAGIESFYGASIANSSFCDAANWLGIPIKLSADGNESNRYVQKLNIDAQATVCFMGDFHGSMHSLMRNLLRLQALGYLNEDMTIKKKNFYMVFLGDYVDRGRWGAEVLITLMKLKLQNWQQVVLLAGNHEFRSIAERYGFKDELILKYGDYEGKKLFDAIDYKFFRTLPVALFIVCNGNVIQCCHGGISDVYQPRNFLAQPGKLFENAGTENDCSGLFWSDFCAGNHGKGVSGCRGTEHALTCDQKYTKKYLKDNNLKAIMRAHQDQAFGLKVFYDAEQYPAKRGPYHWTEVLNSFGISDSRFKLSLFDYYPVFTFSSAVEAREFPYDCFGLINTETVWDQWMMEVYEIFLGKLGQEADRAGNYVCIHTDAIPGQTELVKSSGKPGNDPITVTWKVSSII